MTYNICEGLGVDDGINKGFGIVLLPHVPLIRLILVVAGADDGILLPFVSFYMLRLVNLPELMGRCMVMVVLAVALVWMTVQGA